MIRNFFGHTPQIPETAYVDEAATVIGKVTLGEHASLWPGAVLRGDINSVTLGDYANVQDNSVLHVADDHPCVVGREVVIGHGAIVHGCTIEDGCLIGIRATVLNGAVVGEGSIVAAGALVPENKVLEPGGLYLGAPVKLHRRLSEGEIAGIRKMARKYAHLGASYKASVAGADGADWERELREFNVS